MEYASDDCVITGLRTLLPTAILSPSPSNTLLALVRVPDLRFDHPLRWAERNSWLASFTQRCVRPFNSDKQPMRHSWPHGNRTPDVWCDVRCPSMPIPGPRIAQAKRTKEVLPIVRAAKRVLLLSGTPALNRPKELYPQVRVGRISFKHHLACPECGILSCCSQIVAKAQSAQHLCRAAYLPAPPACFRHCILTAFLPHPEQPNSCDGGVSDATAVGAAADCQHPHEQVRRALLPGRQQPFRQVRRCACGDAAGGIVRSCAISRTHK